jgi:hypothetical protein
VGAMDLNTKRLGASSKVVLKEERQVNQMTTKVIEMGLDSNSEKKDALHGVARVNGAATSKNVEIPAIHVSDDEEQADSDEDGDHWDVESIFEDILAEMDDTHLFDGSK